jgi:hypothetical protein
VEPLAFLAVAVGAALLLGGLAGWAAIGRVRRARRRRLLALPAPPDWEPRLRRNIPVYTRLPEPLRGRLAGLVHVFLDEKRFEGCGGLEMTDEIRLTVAAQACILLLGGSGRFFPQMRSIFVYPAAYVTGRPEWDGALLAESHPRLGESWHRGPVVLAWDAASHRLTDMRGGRNVVMHEFAHQLDSEDGAGDGTPALAGRSSYAEWARVFHREFEALRRRAGRGQKETLDAYGATNPAEFFAVATEAFFERPEPLLRLHPDLYRQLQGYYNLDPAAWRTPADQSPAPPAAG